MHATLARSAMQAGSGADGTITSWWPGGRRGRPTATAMVPLEAARARPRPGLMCQELWGAGAPL
eukprot:COSAG01_NODE_1417_length_10376_cov_8.765009_2_plen_64_part_00